MPVRQGAGTLGTTLESAYGENGFAMIVDEGCKITFIFILRLTLKRKPLVLAGFIDKFGSILATPGIAEKGNLNVRVAVTAPGGHSSVPPPHTVLVTLSSLLLTSL